MAAATDSLDFSMFSQQDFVNLVLQRSEILSDVDRPGQYIKAWMNGDAGPLEAQVARLGATLGHRAAADMAREFEEMRPVLDGLQPKRVADIGCGYGLIDLYFAEAYKSHLVLIDIEENEHRHFGFQPEGAAYSNLATAKSFLSANGVAASKIKPLNPNKEDLGKQKPFDLVISLYSCGFHYPLSTYAEFFRSQVNPGGVIIVDLRAHAVDEQQALAEELGTVEILVQRPKSRRVAIRLPQ